MTIDLSGKLRSMIDLNVVLSWVSNHYLLGMVEEIERRNNKFKWLGLVLLQGDQ